MLIGYNTKDIMLDLTTDQQKAIIQKSGATLFRFPGGADAANRNSFVHSGGLTASPALANDYGDRRNPWAYAEEFRKVVGPHSRVIAVLNLNRHLQLAADDTWYARNLQLLMDLFMDDGNTPYVSLIEMGNEIYNDKTITGLRFEKNFIAAAKKYCALVNRYRSYLSSMLGSSVMGPLLISVCAAPEENRPFKAWNRVLRDTLGDTVSYSHHIYARPADVTPIPVLEMLRKRIGTPMKHMHITEASWQYKEGVRDDPARVAQFHRSLESAARTLNMGSLCWFRLGGLASKPNKYNWFEI